MAYWLDDGFDTWPEVIRAGTAAAGLYTRCGAWIARNLTDGAIPGEVVAMYGTREWAQRLVDAGLWEIDGTGYRDLRYFPMNPTAEQVRKRKQDAADRQQRARDRRRTGVTRDVTRDSRVSHGVSHSSPALPKGQGSARGRDRPPADDPGNPDWRHMPAYGQAEPTPETPARAAARAAAAAARRPPPARRDAAAELDALTRQENTTDDD